jgi:hypothetical protein
MMKYARSIAALIVVTVAAGIHSAPGMIRGAAKGNVSPQTAGDSLSKRNEQIQLYERSFRPSSYELPLQLDTTGIRPALSNDTRDRFTIAAPETVQGYRIQVINTNRYEECAAIRNALLAAFDTWWVYVLFDSPTYRVRIGDFKARLEAKRALEQVQTKGFPDAWLVPDKVVLHLPPRMPLPNPIDSTMTH